MVRWCHNSQPLLERGVGGSVVVTMRKQDILIMITTTCCAAACPYLGWVLVPICFNIWKVGRRVGHDDACVLNVCMYWRDKGIHVCQYD